MGPPVRRRRNLGPAAFLVVFLSFLFLPIVVVVVFAFSSSASLAFPIPGLSLQWFDKALSDPQVVAAIRRSALAAVATGVVAGSLGFLAALGLQGLSTPWRDFVRTVFYLPIATPTLLMGLGLAIYFNRLGIKALGLPMIVLGHVVLALPFVFLTMNAALDRFPPTLIEAARDLGASRARAFWTITLPLVRPAVIGAFLLAAAVSLDEFIVAFFLSGADNTLPIVIYGRIRRSIDPSLNALAVILFVATSLLALLAARNTTARR